MRTLCKCEITWRKGPGELSPKAFVPFIGKEMVLAHGHRVKYAPRAKSESIFTIYLGKNTPERKDYILDKLVVAGLGRVQTVLHPCRSHVLTNAAMLMGCHG